MAVFVTTGTFFSVISISMKLFKYGLIFRLNYYLAYKSLGFSLLNILGVNNSSSLISLNLTRQSLIVKCKNSEKSARGANSSVILASYPKKLIVFAYIQTILKGDYDSIMILHEDGSMGTG